MSHHRFIIADDHPLFRDALRQTINDRFTGARIEEAGSLDEVTGLVDANGDVDLVLLDLKMPGMQGFSGLALLRAQYPGIPVVVVSASDDPPTIRRAMALGAAGYIPKSAPVAAMSEAITRILDGEVWMPADFDIDADGDQEADQLAMRIASLTPQQMRVLMMLREGLLNKQIAYELSVSEATVKAHVSAILQKLNVESRTQAVIAASRVDGEQLLG